MHRTANVLAAPPKSAHPRPKKALTEIWNTGDKTHARDAITSFESLYGVKFGKAAAKITDAEQPPPTEAYAKASVKKYRPVAA